jgi:hypothetical protein
MISMVPDYYYSDTSSERFWHAVWMEGAWQQAEHGRRSG